MSLDQLRIPLTHESPQAYIQIKNGRRNRSATLAQQSPDSPFHQTIQPNIHFQPLRNKAMISKIAAQFKMRIPLSTIVLNTITYHGCFSGTDAVDVLCILLKSSDRNLALLVGRALDAQRFFHHVEFAFRLRDSKTDLYVFPNQHVKPDLVPRLLNQQHSLNRTNVKAQIHFNYSKFRSHSISTSYPSHYHLTSSCGGTTNQYVYPSANTVPLPTGYFTLLSNCYSPTCTPTSLCYSKLCPNQVTQRAFLHPVIPDHHQPTVHEITPIECSDDETQCWSNKVPQSLLNITSNAEVKRQEAIYELIWSEQAYVNDLSLVESLFMDPIVSASLVSPIERAKNLVMLVFGNILDVRDASQHLVKSLVHRQQEAFLVKGVGDICLFYLPLFRAPLAKYASIHPWGKFHLDVEISVNPKLVTYLKSVERMPQARRLPIQSFLGRPLTRAGRYLLLISAISKSTPLNHPDQKDLHASMAEIRSILDQVNTVAGDADNAVRLLQLHQLFSFKSDMEMMSIHLESRSRRLVREGVLKRFTSTSSNTSQTLSQSTLATSSGSSSSMAREDGLIVLLLDHCLVLAKRKHAKHASSPLSVSLSGSSNTSFRSPPVLEYHVHRSAIPLSLVYCHSVDPQPTTHTSTTNIYSQSITGGGSTTSLSVSGHYGSQHLGSLVHIDCNRSQSYSSLGGMKSFSTRSLSPDKCSKLASRNKDPLLVIGRRGRAGFVETLVASNHADRQAWISAIENARSMFIKPLHQFRIVPVAETMGIVLDGKPQTCAWIMMNQLKRLLIATDRSLYVLGQGLCERVLKMEKVSSLAVVQDQDLVLVLADRILWGMSLAAVVHRTLNPSGGSDVAVNKLVSGISAFRVSHPPLATQSNPSPLVHTAKPSTTIHQPKPIKTSTGDPTSTQPRTWVCTIKSSTMSSSIKVYEPVLLKSRHNNPQHLSSGKAFARLFGFSQSSKRDLIQDELALNKSDHDFKTSSPECSLISTNSNSNSGLVISLRVVRELYVPTEANSFHVLESKLYIGCHCGFEVLDPMTAGIESLLDTQDPNLDVIFDGRQGQGIRPLAVILISPRLGSDARYLLCYHHFAFLVTNKGRRACPNWFIEWDDEPKSFSVVSNAYVVAFSSKMIEVWDLATAARVQSHSCDSMVVLDADSLICAVPVLQASNLLEGERDDHDWDSVTMVGSGTHFIFQLVPSHNTTKDTRQQVQRFLVQFQDSILAWDIAWLCLQSTQLQVQFFGAQTLHLKVSRHFNQFQPDQYLDIRTRLLNGVIHASTLPTTTPMSIIRKLCFALVCFAIRCAPEHWIDLCPSLIHHFEQHLSGLLASNPDALQFVPRLILGLIEVIRVLPEELSTCSLPTKQTNAIKFHLLDSVPLVLSTLIGLMTNPGVPIPDPEMDSIRIAGLEAVSIWITFGIPVSFYEQVITLAKQFMLTSPKTIDTSLKLLTELITHPNALRIQDSVCSTLVPILMELAPQFNTACRDHDDSSSLVECIAQCMASLIETYSGWFVTHLAHVHIANTFMPMVLACVAYPGYPGIDQNVTELVLHGFFLIQETIADPDQLLFSAPDGSTISSTIPQYIRTQADQIYLTLFEHLIRKCEWPSDDVWTGEWTKDRRVRYAEWRREVTDNFLVCYYVLQNQALTYLQLQLNQASTWRRKEAVLYAILSLGEVLTDDEDDDGVTGGGDENVSEFLRSVFTPVPEVSHLRVRQTLLLLVGTYASWFKHHHDFVPYALHILLTGIQDITTLGSGARILRQFCDICRSLLVPSLSQFLDTYLNSKHIFPSVEKQRIVEAITMIIQQLPRNEMIAPLGVIFGETFNDLSKYLDVVDGPQETRDAVLHELGMIESLCRGMHVGSTEDSAMVDLTSKAESHSTHHHHDCDNEPVELVELRSQLLDLVRRTHLRYGHTDHEILNSLCVLMTVSIGASTDNTKAYLLFPDLSVWIPVLESMVKSPSVVLSPAVMQVLSRLIIATPLPDTHPGLMTLVSVTVSGMVFFLAENNGRMAQSNPDLVEAFWSLCVTIMQQRYIHILFENGLVITVVQFATHCLTLKERPSLKSAALFLEKYVTHSQPYLISTNAELFNNQVFPVIVNSVMHTLLNDAPRIMVSIYAEIIYRIMCSMPAYTKQWLEESAVLTIPEESRRPIVQKLLATRHLGKFKELVREMHAKACGLECARF